VSDATLTIEVPQREIDDLSRIIRLRAGYLRESMLDATRWAAWFIARAAGAATRISRKKRRVIKNPNRGEKLPQRAHLKGNKGNNWWPFVAIHDFRTIKEMGYAYLPIDAATIQEARQDKKAKIRDHQKGRAGGSGLAKFAWMWSVAQNKKSNATLTGSKGVSLFTITAGGDAGNPQILMHNKLRYAAFAFKTKGQQTVDTIIARGTTSMRKDLEKRAGVAIARGA
jgi:hypothetical protein